MNIPKLLNFFFHQSFKLNSDLLPYLNIVSVSDVVIVKDIDILNSLCLEISVQLLAPFIQKFISWFEKFIGFFLRLKFCFQKFNF